MPSPSGMLNLLLQCNDIPYAGGRRVLVKPEYHMLLPQDRLPSLSGRDKESPSNWQDNDALW
jgi:hypothetical protein